MPKINKIIVIIYNKKILFSIIIFIFITLSSNQILFAMENNETLSDKLIIGNQEIKTNMINDLKIYKRWWNSLSKRQKQLMYFVDDLEEIFKIKNDGSPILNTPQNIELMCYRVGARNISEASLVKTRMQQHIDNYKQSQIIEKSEDKHNKIMKMLETSDKSNLKNQ